VCVPAVIGGLAVWRHNTPNGQPGVDVTSHDMVGGVPTSSVASVQHNLLAGNIDTKKNSTAAPASESACRARGSLVSCFVCLRRKFAAILLRHSSIQSHLF